MTPVFGHGHLRLYLLKLLDESPKHGYELIQALSERFGGTYAPSAGTIYPRLAKLEDEGLVTKSVDGRKTVYEITEAGRAELKAREGELNSIEDELTDSVRRLADEVRTGVGIAMKSLRADLASAARQARAAAETGAQASASWFSAGQAEGQAASGEATSDAKNDAPVDERAATSLELRDVDVALSEFRQAIRTGVRSRSARGGIPRGTAAELKRRLDEVRAAVLAQDEH